MLLEELDDVSAQGCQRGDPLVVRLIQSGETLVDVARGASYRHVVHTAVAYPHQRARILLHWVHDNEVERVVHQLVRFARRAHPLQQLGERIEPAVGA